MIRQPKVTNLALKDNVTGEIHYFDYVVDYRDAYNQLVEETGKRRFSKVGDSFQKIVGTVEKVINPRGEEIFEKPEEKIKRGRPAKSSSVAETPKAPEEIPGTESEPVEE